MTKFDISLFVKNSDEEEGIEYSNSFDFDILPNIETLNAVLYGVFEDLVTRFYNDCIIDEEDTEAVFEEDPKEELE